MYVWEKFNQNAVIALKKANFKTRPNASTGIWACMLIPIALIVSSLKYQAVSSIYYNLNVIAAIGISFVNILLIYTIAKKKSTDISLPKKLALAMLTSLLFWIILKKDWLFSILSGFGIIFSYMYILPFCLYILPLAFSFGEAAICAQGVILFIFSAIMNMFDIEFISCAAPNTNSRISDTVLQVGILGIGLIASIISSFKSIQNSVGFYITSASVILIAMFPMMHKLLNQSPLIWILMFMFSSINKVYVILYWATCVLIAILLMYFQVHKGEKASTALRKYFHILAVFIYLPGFLFECTLLYIATGVVFAIFIILEIMRKLDVWPFGSILQLGFSIYADEKDAAQIALSSIYLLVGCTLPIWLHPSPCDLTDSVGFNLLPLLSGILSVGIGDTMASVIGSNFGKHKWSGSNKSVEGTLSNICFQLLFISFLVYSGFIIINYYTIFQIVFAIVINALIEATTDQVDNLVLPIITYILLL